MYVSGIKGGTCFTHYATKGEADAAFFLAVCGGKVHVIKTPCTTFPPSLFNGGPSDGPTGGVMV